MNADIYRFIIFATVIWHGLAGYSFCFQPRRTIAIFTTERPVSLMAARVMIFLGALNFAVLLPGLVALTVGVTPFWLIPAFYCATNFSQTLYDVIIHRQGITNRRFLYTILAGDAVATLANGILVIVQTQI